MQLTVPLQMLLPDVPCEGIVVNLAELQLCYYPQGKKRVVVYPIGVGQLAAATPNMVMTISRCCALRKDDPQAKMKTFINSQQNVAH